MAFTANSSAMVLWLLCVVDLFCGVQSRGKGLPMGLLLSNTEFPKCCFMIYIDFNTVKAIKGDLSKLTLSDGHLGNEIACDEK